ncbi:hypothetical protein IW261DRAFT_1562217 [Armillaria novae-zelandiae]|uniref:Uncharacterized protein n=1 Tax=Armillaria novae-zelandiae TaxID=153914 RepID=A0AA39PE02_9AGAR|nr:hypothetical protein IW261DRAFT_1562217 [Armillaria novae-zelandiae]
MPFALPLLVLSPPLATPSPGALKLAPPSSSSLPFAFVMLPSFPRPSVLLVMSDDYMVHPSLAVLALALLKRVPPKNFKLAPPPSKLATTTRCVLRSLCSTLRLLLLLGLVSQGSAPWFLVTSVDEDSTNKCARLTSPPRLTAAQKGKGHATSTARITTKQGCSLTITKDVHKVGVKGGLGEKTPEDAVEVEDPALMPLGLLATLWWSHAMLAALPEHNARLFALVQENVLGVPSINMPACFMGNARSTRLIKSLFHILPLSKIFGKVPAALHHVHAENVENLSGLFELGVKEWRDLVDVDAEVAFVLGLALSKPN